MGRIRGWIEGKFKVNDGVDRTVFDESGYLYQRDTKVTASAAEINMFAGNVAEEVFIIGADGVTSNGDIVIEVPFEPTDFIVQGKTAAGAPRAFSTATYSEGEITIDVSTGASTDRWSLIAWKLPDEEE